MPKRAEWLYGIALALPLVAGPGLLRAAEPTPAQQSPAPVDPARLALARQVVEVAFPPETRAATFNSIMQTLMGQMRQTIAFPPELSDPGLRQILDQYFASLPTLMQPAMDNHMPKLLDAMATANARELSADELQQVLAFAKSPAGTHYLQYALKVLSAPEVAAENRAYMVEMQGLVMASSGSLKDRIAAYLKAHPEVAAKLEKGRNKAK